MVILYALLSSSYLLFVLQVSKTNTAKWLAAYVRSPIMDGLSHHRASLRTSPQIPVCTRVTLSFHHKNPHRVTDIYSVVLVLSIIQLTEISGRE